MDAPARVMAEYACGLRDEHVRPQTAHAIARHLIDTFVVLRDGRPIERHSGLPRGHPLNPLDDARLEAKFRAMSERALSREGVSALLDVLWDIGKLADIGELMGRMREIVPAEGQSVSRKVT